MYPFRQAIAAGRGVCHRLGGVISNYQRIMEREITRVWLESVGSDGFSRPWRLKSLLRPTNFSQTQIIKTRLSPIDALIHPRVEVYTAMDFHQAADFIHLGEEAAEGALGEIKQKVFATQIEGI